MICICKKTLDVAIFPLTIDSITEAIIEAYQCGVKVRMIADDECAKNKDSKSKLIARVGIPTKTDNAIYHMHHKFAIMDGSVVIMGSFNWTGQEAKYNQENIFFYEDKNITGQYAQEFERLWNSFDTVIDQKQTQLDVENETKEKEKKKKEQAKTIKEQKAEKNKKESSNTKRVRNVK